MSNITAEFKLHSVLSGPDHSPKIIPTSPLSWKHHGLPIKEIKIHSDLQRWIDYDLSFRNWLYTCLSIHIVSEPLDPVEYLVPDQFIEQIGEDRITIEIFSKASLSGRVQNGVRPLPELFKSCVHVYN